MNTELKEIIFEHQDVEKRFRIDSSMPFNELKKEIKVAFKINGDADLTFFSVESDAYFILSKTVDLWDQSSNEIPKYRLITGNDRNHTKTFLF